MFNRLPDQERPIVRFTFNGGTVEAMAGDSIAAALLANGHLTLRQTPDDVSRGPYCMMGACFECLVDIDGQPNVQACMTLVRDGMVVSAMRGARDLTGSSDDN